MFIYVELITETYFIQRPAPCCLNWGHVIVAFLSFLFHFTFGSHSVASCPAQPCVGLWPRPLYLSYNSPSMMLDRWWVRSTIALSSQDITTSTPDSWCSSVTACLLPNWNDPAALSPCLPFRPGPVGWPALWSGCYVSLPPHSWVSQLKRFQTGIESREKQIWVPTKWLLECGEQYSYNNNITLPVNLLLDAVFDVCCSSSGLACFRASTLGSLSQ